MQQMRANIEQAVETPFSLVILSSAVVSVKESEVRVGGSLELVRLPFLKLL